MSDPAKIGVSRRTLAKGAAWTVPAAAVVAAAPAYAASLRIDPGINGWVRVSYSDTGWCSHRLTYDSDISGVGPDGAPYGLYLYDVTPGSTITNAKITLWIRGNNNASWTNLNGHSSCWGSAVRGTPATKPDGATYTPYTWTYSCPINPANVSPDGRLYLGHFRAQADVTLAWGICDNVCLWAQRSIDVALPGENPETLTFQRKIGFADCEGQSAPRSRRGADTDGLESRRAELKAELEQLQSKADAAADSVAAQASEQVDDEQDRKAESAAPEKASVSSGDLERTAAIEAEIEEIDAEIAAAGKAASEEATFPDATLSA